METRNDDIYVAKRAITTFLSQKFMSTRSLTAFEDLLASSIAPQVMPTWLSALWISLVILRRNKDLQNWWNWGPFCRWRTRPFSECPLSRQIFSKDRCCIFLWLRCASLHDVFFYFRIWRYLDQQRDYLWKSWEIQQVKWFHDFWLKSPKFRFWVWSCHIWENCLCWGRLLDLWGLLVSRIPLEGLCLSQVQVRI